MEDPLGMEGPSMVLRPDEEKLFEGQPKGFPLGGFNIDDVMLPEGDNMGIESEDDDDVEDEIEAESGFGSVIVVDNLPVVAPEKQDKLQALLKKIFSQLGTIRDQGFYMPKDPETNMTKGYAFIEFTSPQEAQAAMAQTNNYKLDKNHTFVVNMFDDFERYSKVPDEYTPPPPKLFEPEKTLYSYLLDSRGRDQFVVRHGDATEVYWNDEKKNAPEQVYERRFWTESFVQWSPRGNFLATMHRQGVAIWGGTEFRRIQRFSHPNVHLMEFSPCENYLTSLSSQEPANPREKATILLNVFDVRSAKKLRAFDGSIDEFAGGAGGSIKWPVFKWAGGVEDKYFARLNRNAISIYECPDMVLLDKKSLKLDGVQQFSWSPAEAVMCAYQSEQAGGNLPARVALIKIPEKVELRQKNLFNVSDVRMFWHPQGDYVAVQVDRFTKTRKSTYTSFELFSVKERDFPMDILELPSKTDKITDFAWEPKGNRFAILHGEGPKPVLSLYAMKDLKSTVRGVQHIGTTLPKNATNLYWSPQGKFLVAAGIKGMSGQLEFVSADDFETLNAGEHFMCTDVEWDPTGRYVATSTTQIHQMENGFNVWLFNGMPLYRVPRERFFQLSWRPRHPSLLGKEELDKIQKNLKQYSQRYEEEDKQLNIATDRELLEERRKLLREWRAWLESRAEWAEEQRQAAQELLGDKFEEADYTLEEVEVEETIGITEDVVRPA